MNFLWYPLEDIPFIFIVLVLSFSLHEFAHAYSAYKFGDRTAYDAGRVTLNPRAHIDVFGTILILLAGFGWAKPVPVNRGRFKHPRLMGIIVSAVGPLSNLLLAVIGILGVLVLNQFGVFETSSVGVRKALVHFFYYLININAILLVFNLIPLPPLDGYRIIQDLVPLRIRYRMDMNEQWGFFIFLLLVFIPPLNAVTIAPLYAQATEFVWGIRDSLAPMFDPVDWDQFVRDFAT
ncbi:site-2 protease family protein [Paenibacillus methanolicus]|uniref:Zn-dependent protease n=1 Tax=Paenibacillus methanolicus TaxID=582686 RepID=A0A5S5CF56_9BACL|nr:site-2 protease family protein [Paenibacillus methanolicus]TYP78031.1 Zn-dependent protease [Paenibacillus methanolicus]